jgi:hypothetical protein
MTFVSPTQVTATILASDLGTAGTAHVVVTNPAPGGGTSNPAPFQITTSTSTVAMGATVIPVGTNPRGVITADFNNDGKMDIAVVNRGTNTVSILRGNGNGTFAALVKYGSGSARGGRF